MIILSIYLLISIVLIILLIYEYIHDVVGLFVNKQNEVLSLILFVSFFWPIALIHLGINKIDKILGRIRNKNIELKKKSSSHGDKESLSNRE